MNEWMDEWGQPDNTPPSLTLQGGAGHKDHQQHLLNDRLQLNLRPDLQQRILGQS